MDYKYTFLNNVRVSRQLFAHYFQTYVIINFVSIPCSHNTPVNKIQITSSAYPFLLAVPTTVIPFSSSAKSENAPMSPPMTLSVTEEALALCADHSAAYKSIFERRRQARVGLDLSTEPAHFKWTRLKRRCHPWWSWSWLYYRHLTNKVLRILKWVPISPNSRVFPLETLLSR